MKSIDSNISNDFQKTENFSTFAKYWRCALQVNPFSYSSKYRKIDHKLNENSYNEALLEKCLKLDIKIVGIADHCDVTSIDALRNVLESHGIVVFPGFEIAANDKTHFVCLFPEGTTGSNLERYLGSLGVANSNGEACPSELSSQNLIDKVDELGGFVYAAHCTSESGLLKNRSNNHVWKLPKLRAVQIPGSVEDLKGVENDFYRKVLLNKDKNYFRERAIAIINAKDVAQPQDLEDQSSTCLIKMTKPNFSAFKMAFLDPDSRVKLNSEQAQAPIGKIISMSVIGGYLDGIRVEFSDHLNTVIGGRGTGKSTLLECVRYALNIMPTVPGG